MGKSYFWCQEDYFVNVALIKDVFKSHPELMDDLQNRKLFNYLKLTKEDYLSYDEIYSFHVIKENYLKSLDNIFIRNNSTNVNNSKVAVAAGCLIGLGSDWGCCGNYSGCCYYVSIECYIHDRMCSDCQPRWFCFSGCVPD